MPELIEQGYVYIAKPPLYKFKNGSKEIYVERDSELEELLLADRIEEFEIKDSGPGKAKKLTKRRWQDFNRHFKAVEGWSSTLRAEFGHETIDFISDAQLLQRGVKTLASAAKLFKARDPKDRPYETKLLEQKTTGLAVKGTHRRSGLARDHKLPKALFDSQSYKQLVDAYAKVLSVMGTPPFEITLGEKEASAESFTELRAEILKLARQGTDVQRFKGLGEMNPEQLRETTMDPETRTLQRVSIDEAAASGLEQTFSDLMGDKVEPRKEFIERHARDVRFLDV
jgi:DNA gyrase subunit B